MVIRKNLPVIIVSILSLSLAINQATATETWPLEGVRWPTTVNSYTSSRKGSMLLKFVNSVALIESGHIFRVNMFGGYFFKRCPDLAKFVNEGILLASVAPIAPFHVMVARQDIVGDSGQVHDEIDGDGFVMMAQDLDPMPRRRALRYDLSSIPRAFVRKSSNSARHYQYQVRKAAERPVDETRSLLSHVSCQ